MKSRTGLNREVESLMREASEIPKDDPRRKQKQKRISNKIEFVKTCLHYLETNPKKDFVERQYQTVLKQLKIIDEGYGQWRENQPEGKEKDPKIYHKEMGVSHLNTQKKTLDFILH